ncbi:hypothetical protein CS542_09095 [Pedobacter sp. IW39]|nr:hypothetical protein CS542_09095 [Pedobacter sp. IW39]
MDRRFPNSTLTGWILLNIMLLPEDHYTGRLTLADMGTKVTRLNSAATQLTARSTTSLSYRNQ